jgi:hypothetical protein
MEVSGQFHAPAAPCSRLSPWYSLDRRLGGLQSRSGRCGEEKNACPCRESNPECLARSPSPYQLSYPGSSQKILIFMKFGAGTMWVYVEWWNLEATNIKSLYFVFVEFLYAWSYCGSVQSYTRMCWIPAVRSGGAPPCVHHDAWRYVGCLHGSSYSWALRAACIAALTPPVGRSTKISAPFIQNIWFIHTLVVQSLWDSVPLPVSLTDAQTKQQRYTHRPAPELATLCHEQEGLDVLYNLTTLNVSSSSLNITSSPYLCHDITTFTYRICSWVSDLSPWKGFTYDWLLIRRKQWVDFTW